LRNGGRALTGLMLNLQAQIIALFTRLSAGDDRDAMRYPADTDDRLEESALRRQAMVPEHAVIQ